MRKSLVAVAALLIAAPVAALAGDGNNQPNSPSSTGPSAPGGFLTVSPPGLANNPHGPPTVPLVFTAGGQPVGHCPNPNGGNGVAQCRPASP
jgi:hypothetical protein